MTTGFDLAQLDSDVAPARACASGDLLRQATRQLVVSGADAAYLTALALLESVTGLRREALLAFPERPLDPNQIAAFHSMVARRCRREPLAYILGEREFYGRTFIVGPSTLIPRPETEGLVDLALAALDARPDGSHFLDVGTGSGAIAVTLLAERPHLRGVATDVDLAALAIARQNARRHGVGSRLHLLAMSLGEGLRKRFPLVVANLPYVPSDRLPTLAPEVALFEPRGALDGGRDGTDVIAALLRALPGLITPDGTAILEIDESHGVALCERTRNLLPEAEVRVAPDARGADRYLVVDWSR